MKKFVLKIGLFIFVLNLALPLGAQSSTTDVNQGFDMTGFPQWTKDLRRAEIIAFGSLPFTLLFSKTVMDTYRSSVNGWDRRYAPWPLTAAGAVGLTQEEYFMTLGFAVGGSIIIALVDHIIIRNRRNRQEQELQSIPGTAPIIIRTPIGSGYTEEDAISDGAIFDGAITE